MVSTWSISGSVLGAGVILLITYASVGVQLVAAKARVVAVLNRKNNANTARVKHTFYVNSMADVITSDKSVWNVGLNTAESNTSELSTCNGASILTRVSDNCAFIESYNFGSLGTTCLTLVTL